ncbi:MAG: GNAT family N-acetyltransferase [Chloroflexi bacterium]|nr:GNAT family N-acetyltransferase [Chloroflexota bacterium]
MKMIPASEYSVEELTALYNETRIDYVVPMPMTAHRLQEYIDIYDIDLNASWVALIDGQEAGLCMTGLRAHRAWITRLGVLPTGRRRGTGQALMESCIASAEDAGVAEIQLEVITGNAPAYRLFSKLGFEELRTLLILRRPPSKPTQGPSSGLEPVWLDEEEALNALTTRPWASAWTNDVESVVNAGRIQGLLLEDHQQLGGWLSYKQTALQITRVIIGPTTSECQAPAYDLLYYLHQAYPTFDTVIENIPADVPHLEDVLAHGYVESFSRVEMLRTVG